MSEGEKVRARSRAIIITACEMLRLEGTGPAGMERRGDFSQADCYILLADATKLFCASVSERYGEGPGRRWSPVLPELLLAHPEKCQETLALLETEEFKALSYFQFVAA